MLRLLALTAILGLFSAVSGVTQAQTRPPEASSERYNFQVTEQGVLRFDSRTGEVSQCTLGPTGPICRAAPDERATFEREIARLETENAALKKVLADRSGAGAPPIPPAPIPDVADKSPAPEASAPSAQNEPHSTKNRVRTAVDTAWRHLVALMSRMRGALQ